ncbi:murein transglycosylase [Fusarium albosuccineum]|uniref:lytic cellulose monooxygenase (C4-dehydrogenating) n=1 Tax=Fusarium albosuccineum TaxID=1237068 RepID=A0A8H4KIY3_9HYPO|nr:murein transglycosylase [Fusarium albosuccineum]
MKFLATALGLASVASAHTLFTTLYIDGENQGDGTCVRQPEDASTANSPIYPVTGDVMACGRDGDKAVKFTCPAPGGAQLTFQFRESPSYTKPGAIAEGHKGPCSVYIKKVDDMYSDAAAGAGWFKIWEDGYDVEEGTWCVDRLRANGGLLSVDLPTGLPAGYYLVRPEVLALHNAPNGDPQFYHSCAQIFIENGPEGPLEIPEKYEVSIPGYVNKDTPGLTFNIYEKPLGEYPIPGPDVWIPTSAEAGTKQTQKDGVVPKDCLAKNANWCGKPIAKYSGQQNCWAAAKQCWNQGDTCWDSAPPSGGSGCTTWSDYCKEMNNACESGNYEGPPKFTGKEIFAKTPGPIPQPYGDFEDTDVTGDLKNSNSNDKASTSEAATPVKTTKASASKAEETEAVEKPKDLTPDYTDTPTESNPEPTSTYAAKPVQTSNIPTKEESSGLKVSQDGRCGGETGQTCEGSSFGDCCSRKGRCGRKSRHCDCGCQNAFGICG